MINNETFMKKCLELAKLGMGKTSPNPMVGCVVLDKNGDEISTGFHSKYGENHAERDALLKLNNDEARGGTLFVNLEPCSHFGKTPPCADLIVERGLKKVVIAMRDVNPIVAGNGVKKLVDAGIEVVEGVLENEARELNEVFIKNMTEKKCFVTLKTATTLDGKIATKTGSSKWITSDFARKKVVELRQMYDAVLTSSSTVITDNPSFDCPVKVLLDRNLRCDMSMKYFQTGKIYVVVDETKQLPKPPENVEFIQCPVKSNKLDLNFLLQNLFEKRIMSVFVEAGGTLGGEFLIQGLIDKIYHFIAPKIIADNQAKTCFDGNEISDINSSFNFSIKNVENFSPDILLTYYKKV